MAAPSGDTTYSERLTAPPTWWLTTVLFGGIFGWIVYVAATPLLALGAGGVATAVGALAVWAYGDVRISAGQDGLRVGRAHLAPEFIGAVTELDRVQFRAQLGPTADARAWLRTRPYVDGGVRVDVDDSADPVPYWLVSSRHPQAVATALSLHVGKTEV